MKLQPLDAPEGRYTRLGPADECGHSDELLCELAERMKDSPERRRGRQRTPAMKAGYVYFGQFIDHDLTRDHHTVEETTSAVEQTSNFRTPRLDLDQLYGKDPSRAPHLFDDGRFRLGKTTAATTKRPGPAPAIGLDDLPRTADGTAIISDDRDDENLLVAQVHVVFAKLHNRFMTLLEENPHLSPGGADLFDRARRLVTWHYQWLVLHDFLPQIVQHNALREIRESGFRFYKRALRPQDAPMALPVEFTVAAFRFGHSMVQDAYILNRWRTIKTHALITMTKRGGGIGVQPDPVPDGPPTVPADFVVDWDSFFGGAFPGQLNRGKQIDTFINEALYELPPQAVAIFRIQLSRHPALANALKGHRLLLPALTLLRGSKMRLATGEAFARAFGYEPLPASAIAATDADAAFFDGPAMRGRTPLWYYILREAAVENALEPEVSVGSPLRIQKLGTIGSRLVAEVLLQVLHADADSILNGGRAWKPPALIFGSTQRPRALVSMPRIVEFIGSRT